MLVFLSIFIVFFIINDALVGCVIAVVVVGCWLMFVFVWRV